MKKSRFEQLKDKVEATEGTVVANHMEKEFQVLCQQNQDVPESFVSHLHNNIFPVVSACRAIESSGKSREEAVRIARSHFLDLMQEPAKMIQKMMKIPGLYHCMPWLWKTLMPKLFSEDSGFKFKFYEVGKERIKFDMLQCPYYQMCKRLDCLDLAEIFCTTDDVCYGDMHPKLIWNRTKTIARGADLCDFDLYVEQKKRK